MKHYLLGLDSSKYNKLPTAEIVSDELYTLESQIPDQEKFKDAVKWYPHCRWCKFKNNWKGIYYEMVCEQCEYVC